MRPRRSRFKLREKVAPGTQVGGGGWGGAAPAWLTPFGAMMDRGAVSPPKLRQ